MTSQAKSESARANGAKSRGPKTEAGKQRSSQNAIRHGLTAQTLVLPCEDPADYQRLLDSYHQQFRPDGPVENDLVREMVAARWRLNRLDLIETQLLADSIIDVEQRHEDWASDDDQPLTPVQALAKGFQSMTASSAFLYRIQSRLEHAYSRALRALLQLQKLRGPSQPPAGPDASGKIENCTNEPTTPGSSNAYLALPEPAQSAPAASGALQLAPPAPGAHNSPPSFPTRDTSAAAPLLQS